MNYPVKICPQCKTQMQLKEGAFELVRKGAASPASATGLLVSIYSCPQCGYIQLYNLGVTARI